MGSKFLSLGVLFIVALVASLLFIWNSNDHLECATTTFAEKDANGCVTTVQSHVCQERFSI